MNSSNAQLIELLKIEPGRDENELKSVYEQLKDISKKNGISGHWSLNPVDAWELRGADDLDHVCIMLIRHTKGLRDDDGKDLGPMPKTLTDIRRTLRWRDPKFRDIEEADIEAIYDWEKRQYEEHHNPNVYSYCKAILAAWEKSPYKEGELFAQFIEDNRINIPASSLSQEGMDELLQQFGRDTSDLEDDEKLNGKYGELDFEDVPMEERLQSLLDKAKLSWGDLKWPSLRANSK